MTHFKTHMIDLLAAEKMSAQALKDHPQIPIIIDILARKNNHHLLLNSASSEKMNFALLESIAHHLSEGHVPKILRNLQFIYFDARQVTDSSLSEFITLLDEFRATHQTVIFAINQCRPQSALGKLISSLITEENWRFVLLTDQPWTSEFSTLKLIEPTQTQAVALLKTYKTELENFHHVLIPEETFPAALSMAMHYLPNQLSFDKALELLDSAAGRASAAQPIEAFGQVKPLVTSTTLMHVLASWTQIPLSHLHNNSFQANKFLEAMQRRLFGQDAALRLMASVLQHACLSLQEKTGPLCNLLLVGPAEVGKREAAKTMAEHLFGHQGALLRIMLNDSYQSVADIKVITDDHSSLTLLNAIQQTPYAVILIENIHQASLTSLNLIKNIFSLGFAMDDAGRRYDFRRAIIILTTTLGSERLTNPTHQTTFEREDNRTLDLMQLVLNETPREDAHSVPHHLSAHELCEELFPALEGYFSSALLQHMHIVPFMPLDYAALEKMMRLKVKALSKRLETQFGIELNYAPEIFKFLAHEALWRKPQNKPIEKLLEQHLYAAIANEILAYAENKNRPKRLLLRLNDNGQLLRCEFLNANDVAMYSI